ncbi:MAG: NADP-dependent oxidoreductase [Betaproteobacteria bacterium]|nr:NADP-dependent oxidoreductase [Betaproteobacteria bacterium]
MAAAAVVSRAWTLASRPQGWVEPGNFRMVEAALPALNEGDVLVKNLWLSLDPYMRGRMSDAKSYAKGVEIGEVMQGQTVGEVLESKHPGFKPGEHVLTQLGWQTHGVARGTELNKVDGKRAPLSYYLGVLGMPGLTAYFGLYEIGQPRAGNTLVVSAASGAVGSVVGQLGKAAGCRVVGIAGGPGKCEYTVKELGFDACLDYKAGNLREQLKAAAPGGVDVYFENVGGEIMDTVMARMNPFSRMVLCGMISDYNSTEPYAMKMVRAILVNRIKVQGMIVFDWASRYPEGIKALAALIAAGKLKYRESIVEGIDNAPQGFIDLLQGRNFGKQLVRIA